MNSRLQATLKRFPSRILFWPLINIKPNALSLFTASTKSIELACGSYFRTGYEILTGQYVSNEEVESINVI